MAAIRWQKTVLNGGWKGLLARKRDILDDPLFASVCLNIDFFGGTITRRKSTRLFNGVTTFVAAGSTTSVVQVQDASQFQVGDVVSFFNDPAVFGIGFVQTGTVLSTFGNAITLTAPLGSAPVANQIAWTLRGPAGRIDGLFQAIFRTGISHLLAAALGQIYDGGVASGLLNFVHPQSTVSGTWGSLTTGLVANMNGAQAGDWIQIAGAGVAGATLVTQVQSIDLSAPPAIVISPAAASFPVNGAVVLFGPPAKPGDTHFVQYGNITHIAQVAPVPGVPVGVPVPPRKYDGFNIRRHGVTPPTKFPVPTDSGIAGTLTGIYSYRVKFRNSRTGQESEPSPHFAADTLTTPVAAKKINLVAIPVSVDPQVDQVRIYRTYSGGNGVWFFVDVVSNGTTTYLDNIPDTALGSQMREFLDNTVPDSVEVFALWPHANRLMGIDRARNAVVFSDEFDLLEGFLKGEAWPVNNQIFVNYDDGDPIVGIAAFFDSQLIFKRRSIWRVIGIPPNIAIEPVSFRADQTGIGTFNQKAIVTDQNEVIFPALDGVYHLSRYEGVQQGFQSKRLSREIDNLWLNVNKAVVSNVPIESRTHAVFHRARRQYRLFVPLVADTVPLQPGTMLPYQFEGDIDSSPMGWGFWQFNRYVFSGGVATIAQGAITASAITQHGAGNQDVCLLGTDLGEIIECDGAFQGTTTGQGDLLTIPIKMEYAIAPFSPAGPGVPVRLRAVDLIMRNMFVPAEVLQLTATGDLGARQNAVQLTATAPTGSATLRSLILTRGSILELDILTLDQLTPVEIHGLVLYWQPLPEETVAVSALPTSVAY